AAVSDPVLRYPTALLGATMSTMATDSIPADSIPRRRLTAALVIAVIGAVTAVALTATAAAQSPGADSTPGATPSEPERYLWDLTDLYASAAAWDSAFAAVQSRVAALERHRGTLGDGAAALAAALRDISDVRKAVARLYVYASL